MGLISMDWAHLDPIKRALPWCLSLVLLTGLIALHNSTKSNESELARLRQENQHLTGLRAESEELKKIQVQVEEVTRLRKENEELHRLRNEVRQLREEKQKSAKTGQSAPSPAPATTEASPQQMQQQLHQLLVENERLRAEHQQLQQAQANAQANACINNLRIIEACKDQWALENKKPAGAPVNVQDIQPYLRNNTLPVCPLGGVYTLNAVGTAPTCNVSGHVLPQQ